jgi:hypothetical protein
MDSSLDMIILSCAGLSSPVRAIIEQISSSRQRRGLPLARITTAEASSVSILSASQTDFRKHYEAIGVLLLI